MIQKTIASKLLQSLCGDLVASRAGTAPSSYPNPDNTGTDAYVPLPRCRLILVRNNDASNPMIVLPDDRTGTFAYLTVGTPSTDAITFYYKAAGTAGNSFEVEILVAGTDTPLSVAETASKLTINSATDGGGAATSTPAEIVAAIDALNSGAGSTYVFAYADGTSAVSAATATTLANGIAAGSAARVAKMGVTPSRVAGYYVTVASEDYQVFSSGSDLYGISLQGSGGTTAYEVFAFATEIA